MEASEPRPAAKAKPAEFSIDLHGRWHYRGSIIQRDGLLRLLAAMLQRDERGYVLVTPDQRLRVDVADVPFIVTAIEARGERERASIRFRSSLGDEVPLDADHPLRMGVGPEGGLRPYLVVRDGMEAVLHRNVFYALADLSLQREIGGPHGVFSDGVFFPLE